MRRKSKYNPRKARRRYITRYEEHINAAEAEIAKITNIQNQLKSQGKLVEGVNIATLKGEMSKYRDYVKNKNFTYKQANRYLERIKDISKRHLLLNTLQVKVTDTLKTGKPVDKVVTMRYIDEKRRQHSKDPAKVSDFIYNRVQQITGALNPVSNSYATSVEGLKSMWRSRLQGKMDISFGGTSTLINDLAYSMDAAGGIGREFVDTVMQIMQNEETAKHVEALYRGSPAGQQIKRYLDQAVGRAWLDNFKNAIPGIMGLIRLVETLNLDEEDTKSLEQLLEKAEQIGAEGYEEYITGSP